MKLIFSLTFILALYGTAAALRCLTCTDQTCSNTASITCASETMCISATILASQPGASGTRIYKACASSSLCPVTGSGTFSVALATQSATADAQCCDTDDCNAGTQPSPTTPSPNSTTTAPTTTTTAAPTTTTTAAPTTTTTAAPTTTTTAAPTTTTTTASATITTTTTSNASSIRFSLFHLLFGFFMFFIYNL